MMCFHAANFGLPIPFRSRVRSRHRQTDGRTDRWSDTGAHFIMHAPLLPYGGGGIISLGRKHSIGYGALASAPQMILFASHKGASVSMRRRRCVGPTKDYCHWARFVGVT